MNAFKLILAAVLILFTLLTAYTLTQVGYFGIFEYHLHSSAGWQVIVDLVIACGLAAVWMILDARQMGRNPWPFVLLTLVAGSFGPLLYLLTRSPTRRLAQP